MRPFEFIILFCSFAYALALTHIFFAITRMIRHRRVLTFSAAHAAWMALALVLAVFNWFALWDLHATPVMSLGTTFVVLGIVATQYFVCALVAPDFDEPNPDGGESYDMRVFHAREGRTYMGAVLVLMVYSLVANLWGALAGGVGNWGAQNLAVLAMAPFAVLPLVVRAAWAQVLSPLVLMVAALVLMALYYPALR
ncbi:MAG TPA: hypothetical protein VG248_07120 [Caulobacteraceae bacterium]|jgi:hypothetical protein|nr:hypothetical protein [Caulobacteraceae bacterium]